MMHYKLDWQTYRCSSTIVMSTRYSVPLSCIKKNIHWIYPPHWVTITTRIIILYIFLVGNPHLNLYVQLESWMAGRSNVYTVLYGLHLFSTVNVFHGTCIFRKELPGGFGGLKLPSERWSRMHWMDPPTVVDIQRVAMDVSIFWCISNTSLKLVVLHFLKSA